MSAESGSQEKNKLLHDQRFPHNVNTLWQIAVLFDDQIIILTGRRWPWPCSLSACCTLPWNRAWAHSAFPLSASSLLNTSEAPQQGRTAAQQPSARSLKHRQERRLLTTYFRFVDSHCQEVGWCHGTSSSVQQHGWTIWKYNLSEILQNKSLERYTVCFSISLTLLNNGAFEQSVTGSDC